jgi:F-type H+-transporting ATPase subunit delta
VTSGAAAGRYARALFDVILKEQPGDLDGVQAPLQDLATLFTTNAALAGVMGNPAVPVMKKIAITQAVLEKTGALPAPLGKLILMLAERDRLMLLPQIARLYRERVMDHQQVIRGEVTTALALAPAKVRALEQGLAQATGRRVVLEAKVDPSIIGGLIARLGSTVYDASVVSQLQKMKQTLIEAGQ